MRKGADAELQHTAEVVAPRRSVSVSRCLNESPYSIVCGESSMNRFVCPHCPKEFRNDYDVDAHIIVVHGVEAIQERPGIEPKAWAAVVLSGCSLIGLIMLIRAVL